MSAAYCTLECFPGTDPTAGVTIYTPQEIALITRAEVRSWFNPVKAGVSAGTDNRITKVQSLKPDLTAAALELTPRAANAPNEKPLFATLADGSTVVLCGYASLGSAPDGGVIRRMLEGSAALTLPMTSGTIGPFVVSWLGTHLATGQGTLWSVGDTSRSAGLELQTNGQLRFFGQYRLTTNQVISAVGVNDGNIHLWTTMFDGTTLTVYKDGTSIASGAVDLSGFTSAQIRIGGYVDGTGTRSGVTGYWRQVVAANYVDDDKTKVADLLAVIKAFVAQDQPALAIA